jgi:transposase
MSDAEWELISDLVPVFTGNGKIGRPLKHDRRVIVNAIFYVAATGCQWRALPDCYPSWNTVHRYHLRWSRDGTWENIADRLRRLVRQQEGHDPDPSAGVVDARSVRGAPTVTSATRGYDAGKKISGRKCFGIVDTLRPARRCRRHRGQRKRQPRRGALLFRRVAQIDAMVESVLRRRIQDHVQDRPRRPACVGRGRLQDPSRPVRSPPETVDRGTDPGDRRDVRRSLKRLYRHCCGRPPARSAAGTSGSTGWAPRVIDAGMFTPRTQSTTWPRA